MGIYIPCLLDSVPGPCTVWDFELTTWLLYGGSNYKYCSPEDSVALTFDVIFPSEYIVSI